MNSGLKIYLLSYPGFWLGGTAVVLAKSLEEAKQLLLDSNETVNRKHGQEEKTTVEQIEVVDIHYGELSEVVYNWNGDY